MMSDYTDIIHIKYSENKEGIQVSLTLVFATFLDSKSVMN